MFKDNEICFYEFKKYRLTALFYPYLKTLLLRDQSMDVVNALNYLEHNKVETWNLPEHFKKWIKGLGSIRTGTTGYLSTILSVINLTTLLAGLISKQSAPFTF